MTTPIGRNDPTHELEQIFERLQSTRQSRPLSMQVGSPEHIAQTTHNAILTLVTVVQGLDERLAKIEQALSDVRSKPPTNAVSPTE